MIIKDAELHLITRCLGNRFMRDRFRPVQNNGHKPAGGLWASPVGAEFGWYEWCVREHYHSMEALSVSFTYRYTGTIIKIDSVVDMDDLCWYRPYPDVMTYYENVDFERTMALGIDAIWLTERGEHQTRFTSKRNLYGWDCESVFIMNPDGISETKKGAMP